MAIEQQIKNQRSSDAKKMSYFGDSTVKIDEFKEVKLGLFDHYNRVFEGYVPPEDMLVPLMNWFSNSRNNIQAMQNVNQYFFWADKKILSRMIILNVDLRNKWLKYPKRRIEDDETAMFIIPFVCEYYGWTEREYDRYAQFIDLKDTELLQELHRAFGFTSSECKKLGIPFEKIKAKFEKTKISRGYF